MKFLIDVNIGKSIERFLKEQGFDILYNQLRIK